MALWTLFLAGLILLAFINLLTVISMLKRLEDQTHRSMAQLDRKLNHLMAHMQIESEPEENENS